MKAEIVLLLIAVSFISVKAQEYEEPKFHKRVTTELFYSISLPTTDFGIKCHVGNKWGGYAHARINVGFSYLDNNFTTRIGSFGASYKVRHNIKPYIGVSVATRKRSPYILPSPFPLPPESEKTGNYWGGETGLLLFIFHRVVLDVGFCYAIEPNVNLGVGISF